MKAFWNKLHKIGDFLHLPDLPNWLVIVLTAVLILRTPSFFEPYYYGDEMVYLTLGQGVRQGATLYKDIHDNKPPLLYLTAAVAGNLFWFKVILAFWNIVTIVFFYKLTKIILEKNDTGQKVATILFSLLTTLPLLEGLTVNSELFMVGFTIISFLILLSGRLSSKKILFAGSLLGIATLFKVPAAFDAPVIVLYWTITEGFKNWKDIFKRTAILLVGFLIPIFITFIYYFFAGAFTDYLRAAFLQNVGYLSSFRPQDTQKPFIVRNAPLLIRAALVFLATAIIYIFRNRLSKKFILLSLWTALGLFAITLSERPYPHYLIQILAPLSLFFAILFFEKSFEQSLTVIPLAVIFTIPFIYHFYFYPTSSYYLRFIKFAANQTTQEQYIDSFDINTQRNYKIAHFLAMSSSPSDRVFMWDPDSAAVYALSRRLPPVKYVVPYHVLDYSSKTAVAEELSKNPPKFIITTSGNFMPEIQNLLLRKYILIQQIDNANVWSRINI